MSSFDFDLFVIGAGSGGVSSARYAASLGKKVGICESYRVGGTCVIRGCVPKKLFVYSSHISEEIKDAKSFGWTIPEANFSWETLINNKNKEIDRLNQIYLKMLDKAGVELFMGEAKFIDKNTVEIAGKKITSQRILIATGAKPFVPKFPGSDLVISSNEAFHLKKLPKSIAIVGGGYIAVEFAGIFHGLGVDVKLIYRRDKLIRGFDEEIRDYLTQEIVKKGIDLRLEENIISVEKDGESFIAELEKGEDLKVDQVMYATGRIPNTSNLNLEAIGIETKKNGAIKVNDESQTNLENIYAVGDVTDRMNLTPVAINEGRAFVDTVFNNKARKINYEIIPSAVFSQPSVGSCGLTEEKAREKYGDITIFKSEFRPMKYSLGDNPERTLMKLIVENKTDKVLGAHMVGPDAAEIIQGVGIALTCGATKAQFDQTIGIHPSSAEEFVTMRVPS